jgi:hypothetical protein
VAAFSAVCNLGWVANGGHAIGSVSRGVHVPELAVGSGTRSLRRRWSIGSSPLCALCAGPGQGDVAVYHLPYGVSLLLCEGHRSNEYLRRDGGQDFVDELTGMWGVAGALAPRYRRALAAHLRSVARLNAAPAALPGSYSWPMLRAEAEQRFAAGEPPAKVISELRARHRDDHALAPSIRTMRRWFTQGRWLLTHPDRHRMTHIQRPRRLGPLETIDYLLYRAEPHTLAFHGWPRGTPRGVNPKLQ